MKRFQTLAAMAATLLLGASCQKQAVTSVAGEGDVLRTISVNLGDAMTKASSSLSGEGAIEDATLFVWQHNAETDETTLYQKAYAEASTFEFSLLFSDQTEYTYSINAWANMGELDAEPSDGEVLFIGEEASGLQMKGSRSGIDQASASALTIDMKRYVGKITVAEVALEWTNDQNALQDFTLKSIYVANAGDKAEGATATYNVGGAYVSSAMDAMLYSPVNSVIADGASYSTAQMMYAYGSGSTAIVLECDLGGQTMYYHVDYEPEWNTHRVFRFTVRQAGADTPLGELPEEAIEVSVITLNVLDWDADEQETDFGEIQGPDDDDSFIDSDYSEDELKQLPFYIEAREDGVSCYLSWAASYSIDGGTSWVDFNGNRSPVLNQGQRVYIYSDISAHAEDVPYTSIKGRCNIGGNIMSLVYKDEFKQKTSFPDYSKSYGIFQCLFEGCSTIVHARDLILPAVDNLHENCYYWMFRNCTSLETAPELPATELADNCYYGMFTDCAKLTTAPELPATALAEGCYSEMFSGCTSLTAAPELPATELVDYCYASMFYGCKNLNYVKASFTDATRDTYLFDWLYGVADEGLFIRSKDVVDASSFASKAEIPDGWTIEVAY